MTYPTGRMDTTPSRRAQCPMLSSPDLMPSLHVAAQQLLTELHLLHPGVPADAQDLAAALHAPVGLAGSLESPTSPRSEHNPARSVRCPAGKGSRPSSP